jgi:hypothetical protein
LRGGGDPDNRRDFPGGFPGDPRNAFSAAGRAAEQAAIFDHVRALLHLRRESEPLRRGDCVVVEASREAWVCSRQSGRHTALTVLNNGTQPLDLDLPASAVRLDPKRPLRARLSASGVLPVADGRVRLRLPARASEIYAD